MERKKRKWDVAAPAGTAAVGPGRAGIGSGASTPAQYVGLVTGQVILSQLYSYSYVSCMPDKKVELQHKTLICRQGLVQQAAAAPAPALPSVAKSEFKPGQPLAGDIIARAQAGAAAAMEKINRVCLALHEADTVQRDKGALVIAGRSMPKAPTARAHQVGKSYS
jgi:hypothetical protein